MKGVSRKNVLGTMVKSASVLMLGGQLRNAGAQQGSNPRDSHTVKNYGAIGNGLADDADAFQAAMAAAAAAGGGDVEVAAGTYKLTAGLHCPSTVSLRAQGRVILKAHHNGSVIKISDGNGVNESTALTCTTLEGISFDNAPGFKPLAYVEIGDGAALKNGINVTLERCFFMRCAATYGVLNSRGYNLTVERCVFNSFAGIGIATRNSFNDNPYWSYAVSLYGCDFTNITGKALDIGAGYVHVFGGVIESCSQGAIDVLTSASGLYRANCSFYGVHFEQIPEFILRNGARQKHSNLQVKFDSCIFNAGAATPNVMILGNRNSQAQAQFSNCTSNGGIRFVGGLLTFSNSYEVFDASHSRGARVNIPQGWTLGAVGANPVSFKHQLNVSEGGGGGALILCSHQSSSGNATVTELFLIRYGNDSGIFSATSVCRSAGADPATFRFFVDAGHNLQVASSGPGYSRYQVVADMRGEQTGF